MNEDQTVNISLGAAVPVVETPKDEGHNHTTAGLSLPDPFTSRDLMRVASLSLGAATSQIRRWEYWSWIKRVGFGQYSRTQHFGVEKIRPQRVKGRVTSKGYVVKASMPCDVPGCNYIGYGSTQMNAQRSIGRHKSMAHGIKKKYIPVGLRHTMGLADRTKYAIPRQQNGAHEQPQPAQPTPAPEHHLKFCPECGYNIQMHEVSFRIAKKHSRS